MELDIVMLSVLMISSLLMDKLMSRTGQMIKDTMAAAVQRWIFLNQINMPMLILLMFAQFQATIDVRVKNAEMVNRDKMVIVTRMDVT